MRGYSVIHYTEAALKKNADSIIELAEAENMRAHALAVKVRKPDFIQLSNRMDIVYLI